MPGPATDEREVMSFVVWVAVLGGVLLTLALTSSYLRWMPVTTSAVCLLLGIGIGPSGFGLLKLSLEDASLWMEPPDRGRGAVFAVCLQV
jgi:NhaP-type Na+/H+ or K+/H+ antiporter